ncbi:uncharacterized protein LOC143913357 isoform X2 [Arctopsyche grandis]
MPWDGENYSFGYLTSQGLFRTEKGYWVTAPNGVMFLMVVGAYSKILHNSRIQIVDYYSDLNGYHEQMGLTLEEYLEDSKIRRPVGPGQSGQPGIPGRPIEPGPSGYPGSSGQSGQPGAPGAPGYPGQGGFGGLSDADKSIAGNIVMDGDFMKPNLDDLIAKRMRQMKRAILIKLAILNN